MIEVVFLDTTPLGLVVQRIGKPDADACRQWVKSLEQRGVRVLVPEIADYEVRRELVRAGATAGVERLDTFLNAVEGCYVPITTRAMRYATQLWAEARNQGYATADPKALDGDVILAAQALTYGMERSQFVVASDNVGHLARYVPAELWEKITPPVQQTEQTAE